LLKHFPKTQIANIGEDYELVCEVTRSNPPPSITWQVYTCANLELDSRCKPIESGWVIAAKVDYLSIHTISKLVFYASLLYFSR